MVEDRNYRVSIAELQQILDGFRDQREWADLHTPDDLAKAVVVEAAELLEIFMWSSRGVDLDDARPRVADEMADIFIYLLYLARVMQVDLTEAVLHKIEVNSSRFPASPLLNESRE